MAHSASLQIRARLMRGDDIAMGPGKADLLQAIATTGSISAAARQMGMSYRRAWLLVDTMNHCFQTPLVSSVTGGSQGGGARLTPLGEEVLALYQRLQQQLDEVARPQAAALRNLLAKTP